MESKVISRHAGSGSKHTSNLRDDSVETMTGEESNKESNLSAKYTRLLITKRVLGLFGFLLIMLRLQSVFFAVFGPPLTAGVESSLEYFISIIGGALGAFWFSIWFWVGVIIGGDPTPSLSNLVKRFVLVGSLLVLFGSFLTMTILEFGIGMMLIISGNVIVILVVIKQRIIRSRKPIIQAD